MTQDAVEKFKRRIAIQKVFRPGAPVEKQELFSERSRQMNAILDAISQPGRHAVLYGERGVGKTSIAKVMSELLQTADPNVIISGTINCDSTDDFSSIWHKVFREVSLTMQVKGVGFAGMSPDASYTLDGMLNEVVTPDDIRFTLSMIKQSVVILLDEFNTLQGKESVSTLIAETLKNLSDHTLTTTVVVIGVADSVSELIAGHKSVERSIEQILMPRMTPDELSVIIDRALEKIDMTMADNAKEWIVGLSMGLPHYTHLLARDATLNAFDSGESEITMLHVLRGIESAAGNEHSLMERYNEAIASPQKSNRFAEVLLACAKAPTDGLGWFAPADVSKPLGDLTSRRVDVASFSRHLGAFCDEKRDVLESKGEARSTRYRFKNPLMQPFVILQGIKAGKFKVGTSA